MFAAFAEAVAEFQGKVTPEQRVLVGDRGEVLLLNLRDHGLLDGDDCGTPRGRCVDQGHFADVLARLADGQFAAVDPDGYPTGQDQEDIVVRSVLGNQHVTGGKRLEHDQFGDVSQIFCDALFVLDELLS